MDVKIMVLLNDIKNIFIAINDNNAITYNDGGSLIRVLINEKKIEKENEQSKLLLDFKENKCFYFLKEENIDLALELKVQKIECDFDFLKVTYLLENQLFNYEMSVIK